MNAPFISVKSRAAAVLFLLATASAILLSFVPVNAGLSLKNRGIKPSFVVYSVGPGEQASDDAEQGFSAIFIDALASADANEDVAVTIRRTRANLKHPSTPAVEDLLEGSVSLRNTSGAKKALLVAVEKYETGVLTAPVRDARRLDRILQGMDYQTEIITDPDPNAFALLLDKFAQGLEAGDQVVFYFSGGGFDLSEAAHLVLRDMGTPVDLEAYMQSAVPFETVHGKIAAKVRNAIFILDIDRSELGGSGSTRASR